MSLTRELGVFGATMLGDKSISGRRASFLVM
jgi:hypothetical protein